MSVSEGLRAARHGVVTYPIIGTILAAAAGLGLWALQQHGAAGHPRHDEQVAFVTSYADTRLKEHALFEQERLREFRETLGRIERKTDATMRSQGIQFTDLPGQPPAEPVDPLLVPDGGTPR